MSDYIGVVFDRAKGGAVVRVINPDCDHQLDAQIIAASEYMLRVPKEVFSISKDKDAMTIGQVARVCDVLGPRK